MSDSSDSSTASDTSINDISDEEFYGYDHNDQEEWSDFADAADDDSMHEDDPQMENISRLVLCSKHKKGQMLSTCPSCSAACALIKDKTIIEKLSLNTVTDSESAGASLMSRYGGRCDIVEPTLVLDPFIVKVAADIFNKGVWKDSKMWTEVIKNFLTLPIEQHELLTSNLKSKELLNKFRREPRFKGIFKYQTDLANCLKSLRIGQRPLLKLMERLNNDITLWAICYQVEPPFENFQILGINTSQMMTNGTQNLLQKKKKFFDQNCERRSQFSVFEATS